MVREILRQAAALVAIGAMFGCGSDGPVGPSASTTSTSVSATSTTTVTTTAPPTTLPTTSTSVPPTVQSSTTTTSSIPIVTTSTPTSSIPIVTIVTTSPPTSSIPIVTIVTTSMTTSSIPLVTIPTTSTTTTAAVSFASVVWPHMGSCDFCHTEFNSAASAYTFAFNRSAANSLNSLFYRKPTGRCSPALSCAGATPSSASNPTGHSGGTIWPTGSAGEIATAQWIQGGRGI